MRSQNIHSGTFVAFFLDVADFIVNLNCQYKSFPHGIQLVYQNVQWYLEKAFNTYAGQSNKLLLETHKEGS